MSSTTDKIIKKKVHYEGVIQKRSNHVLYEDVDSIKKLNFKIQKKSEPKPKPAPREILDNYRYLETKEIRNKDKRNLSIVTHKRLGKSIGKETSYERSSFKEYKTNTTFIQKTPKLGSYDTQKINKKAQNKYSEKTYNQNNKYGERSNKEGQFTNSRRANRKEQYSSNATKLQKNTLKNLEKRNENTNKNSNVSRKNGRVCRKSCGQA